jgi:hypothetical protein
MLIDYNGPGDWGLRAVQERYRHYALAMQVTSPLPLEPDRSSDGTSERIYPVMDEVISRAEAGDPACVELAIELVESGHSQPFGRLLKYRAARALRRVPLSEPQAARLRRRVLSLLDSNGVCREFREYAKLLRALGLPENWRELCRNADASNPYVRKYLDYLETYAAVRPGAGV